MGFMRRRWIVGLGMVAALMLLGCGSEESESTTTTTTSDGATLDEGIGANGDDTGDAGDLSDLSDLGDGEGRVPSPDGALSPEEARQRMAEAGYECSEIEGYEVGPEEVDLGVAPSATFGCDGDDGSIEFIVAADEADVGRLFVVIERAGCGFEPDLALTGEGRWIAGPRDEGDPDAVAAAADVLGTELLQFECD